MIPAADTGFDPDDEQIPLLQAEIAKFEHQREETLASIKELMAAEDPKNGVSHHEDIFRLRQDKLRLDVEIQLREVKINRIRQGIADGPSTPPRDGFAF